MLERLLGAAGLSCLHERSGIAPDRFRIQAELLVSGRDEYRRADCAAQHIKGLVQSVSGARLVQIRPEQAEKGVASVRVASPAGG
jgi:hypothetical protein